MRTVSIVGAGGLLVLARATPAHGPEDLRFTSVSAGGSHSCGLTADSAAYCWGRNEFGQLGDSSNTDRSTPVPVAGGIAFRVIAAGELHTCAIATDDTPYCWGNNDNGQAGIGTNTGRNYPARIAGVVRVTAISAGARHTCATIVHWERQGQMVCWGSNSHGQLGTGGTHDAWAPVRTFGTTRYTSIAAGSRHTCAVSEGGKVFCWGANARGQLGNASRTPSPVPFPIRILRRATFSSVVAGAAHTCALTSEGEAYCWGENAAGQLGAGKNDYSITPTRLDDPLRFTALSAGGNATCGLRRDGGVSCWGSNAAGQFGTGATTGSPTPVPAVPGLMLTAISLGRAHACGLQADGSVYCWGELGNGLGGSSAEPVRVTAQP